jgi:tetratricopeptide (TPR) repeat protein
MPLLALRNTNLGSVEYRAEHERLTALWRGDDRMICEQKYRESYDAEKKAHEISKQKTLKFAQISTFLGRLENSKKNYAAAATHLREAENILVSIGECPASLQIAWLLEYANLSRGERTPSQSRIAYSEAWTLAVDSEDEENEVEIAERMAESEPLKVRIGWIEKGIEIASSSKNDILKTRLSTLYRAQGRDHHELRRYPHAIESYRKSFEAAKDAKNITDELLAESAKGNTLRAMHKTEEALELQMNLLSRFEGNSENIGEVYEEVAECLHALKRVEEAEGYFASAHRTFSTDPHFEDRRPGVLKRLKTLGKIRNS